MNVALLVALAAILFLGAGWLIGKRRHTVTRIGRDTYLRFYPNMGVGLCLGTHRVALSVVGGFEVFERHPVHVWRRIKAYGSRVKRPGGKV